jgi:hypothetical protein
MARNKRDFQIQSIGGLVTANPRRRQFSNDLLQVAILYGMTMNRLQVTAISAMDSSKVLHHAAFNGAKILL